MVLLDTIRIEALNSQCTACGNPLHDRERIVATYPVSSIRSFEKQIELGILGAGIRNYWVHLDCTNPFLQGYSMIPDITHCIHCKNLLTPTDIVLPVFQVTGVNVANPEDPTDKGLTLGDRVYFVHANCKNRNLKGDSGNLLYTP